MSDQGEYEIARNLLRHQFEQELSKLISELDSLRAHLAEEKAKHALTLQQSDRLSEQLDKVRNAGNQALRQWKMYADMTDGAEDFEKSAEGSVYLACKSLLTDENGK